MTDNEKFGLLAVVLVIIGLVVGVFALLKVLSALLPMLAVGGIVGGLLWLKYRK